MHYLQYNAPTYSTDNTKYRLLHRIFIHELQDFGKRTSERSERVSFSKVLQRVNKNPYNALSML